MNIEPNGRVQRFIADILSVDDIRGGILVSLREMILQASSGVREKIMYGGIVYIVDSELISGIFVRKKHVSLEFGFGMKMSDPEGFLEGSGKYRRHLKLMHEDDIANKNAAPFVIQALPKLGKNLLPG